jgi:Protein of unknown function (DUF3562)
VSEATRPTRKRKASDEATVSALALKACVPREFVQHLYDEEMAELESTSTVKNFINVIAGNRVRQRLAKHSTHTSQSVANHPEAAGP